MCVGGWVGGWVELGHYIPELAKAIVDGNKEASSLKINLKGFMVSTTHAEWI
jgi:carboxypeptidase C (cathepsin A)